MQEFLAQFGAVFPNALARDHLAEYLTGLFIAERKMVSGISREFAVTTDQSCLNRWLTAAPWDVQTLNAHRLAWLQQDPPTKYRNDGVIALDTPSSLMTGS